MARLARLTLIAVLGALLAGAGAHSTPSTSVVISQVYGGGGNIGAPYKNDFVELHNVGNSAVDLSGWSVQYASAAGTSWASTSLASGSSIQAGGYYLVKEASGGTPGSALPTADANGTTNLSNSTGKVALVSGASALSGACPASSTIVDLAGYGSTASCYEGTAPAPSPSSTSAILRAGSGCTDTDYNSADFSSGAPAPRNSASTLLFCVTDDAPAVASTSPAADATEVVVDADLAISFSEAVAVAGAWFSISCETSGTHSAAQSGGPVTYTLDPDSDFNPGETCAVTISAPQVADEDLNDPPDTLAADYTFDFETVVPAAYVVSSSSDEPIAGDAVTISAQLVDASGTPIPQAGRTVDWSSTGTGGSLASATSQTNASGVATVDFTTSTSAGVTHTVTATDASSPSVAGVSGAITTVPGPADHLAFTSSAEDLPSGASRTLTVELRDRNENVVPDSSTEVMLAKSAGAGTLDGLGSATASSGVASRTVTGKTAGSITVAATAAGLSAASASFMVVPGQADHLAFTSPAGDVASGTTAELAAEIRDANENVVTGDGETSVTFEQTAGSGTVSDLGTATASAGVATREVSGMVAGPVTVVATGGGLAAATATFTVVPGTPTHLVFTSSTASLANGKSRLLAVEVRDTNENLVRGDSGRTVTFFQLSGGGAVSGLGSAVTMEGKASIEVTGSGGGAVTITAAASSLADALTTFTVLAPDGSGTIATPTVRVLNGAAGVTITFTYKAASGGLSNGQLALTVPTGWSAPSTTDTAAGYVAAGAGTRSVSGQTITVSRLTLQGGETLQLVYGSKAAGGPGAQAPTAGGTKTWTAKSKASPLGTLTALAASPAITVLAADGSGTLTTPTRSVKAGSTGNTIVFTYTAAAGGIYNGAVTLGVPAGWSAPSTTGAAPGFVQANAGSLSVSSRTVTVSRLTLAQGKTVLIVYGSKAGGGPGATASAAAGTQTWTAKSKASSGGTLKALASSPSITVTP